MLVLCLRPARAGRAAQRLAPARPARPAARGLHVARRDGRGDAARRSTCWPRGTTSTPRRLGLTGASGGGFVSTFAAAVDDTRRRRRDLLHPQHARWASCATPPSAPAGTAGSTSATRCRGSPRRPRWAWCSARPRPARVTVVHAIDDPPFPIAGARAVVGEAARIYDALGAGGRVRLRRDRRRARPARRDARRRDARRSPRPSRSTAPGARGAGASCWRRAYAVTHEVARADARSPDARARTAARLPGESLTANADTNSVLVRLARDRARHAAARPGSRRWRDVAARSSAATSAPTGGARASSRTTWRSHGGFGQRLDARRRAGGRRSTPCCSCPAEWDDDAARRAGRARRGRQGAWRSHARRRERARERGWAVLAPDAARHRRERSRRVRARDGRVDARPRPAREPHRRRAGRRPAGSRSATRRASSSTSAPHRRARGPGAFGLIAAARGGARRAHRGRRRAARSPRASRAAGREPRDHADGVSVRRARDVRPAPTSCASAGRGRCTWQGRRAIPPPSWTPLLGCRRGRRMIRRGGRRDLELRAGRRPAHRPPGRDRRRRCGAGGRHRPARGRPRRGLLPLAGAARPARAGRAASRTPTATTRRARPSCWRRTRTRACSPAAADLALVGDPERTIRERYARFAERDDVPFGQAAAERARSRAGLPFEARRGGRGRTASTSAAARPRSSPRPATAPGTSPRGSRRAGPGRRRRGDGHRRSRSATATLLIPPMYAPPAAYAATIARIARAARRAAC